MKVSRFLSASLPMRFLADFWRNPNAAVRRYSKRRTWPTSEDIERMTPVEFESYMRSIGMVALPIGSEDRHTQRRLSDA